MGGRNDRGRVLAIPAQLTQATQATKARAPPIRPMRESTNPAVRMASWYPSSLALLAWIRPTIPKMTERMEE